MFSDYLEADVAYAENRGSRISKENIDTDLDFDNKVLDADYVAVPAPSLLLQMQGDHVGSLCTLAEQCVLVLVHSGCLSTNAQIDCSLLSYSLCKT